MCHIVEANRAEAGNLSVEALTLEVLKKMFLFAIWMLSGLQLDLVRYCDGLRIAQCVSNVSELDMESLNNEITCDMANRTAIITWSFTDGGSNSGTLTCRPSQSCTEHNLFTATRASQSTSSTLTPRADIKRFRTIYGAITLSCHTTNPATSVETDRASCELDVVHQAEVTSCSAQFNTTVGTDWTASGSCVISKAFSQRGRYSCLWTETTSGTSASIQSSLTFTGSFDEGGVTYRSMTCDFQKPLPHVTSGYNYTAVIFPGAVQPGVNFTGSSSIVLPTAHTNCPTDYVTEGDNVDCTCSSTYGNPAGSAEWRLPSGSSHLELNDVRRDNHGDSYVCEVKLGSDVVSNVTFRLQVAYPPVISITSLPSDTCSLSTSSSSVTCVVMEGQRVKVNCTAHSNPSVATIAWQPGGGSVLDLQADRATDIDYKCNVYTVDEDGSGNRLPLHSSTELAVLVKYKAEASQFTVNGDVINQTVVNETDTVSFNCTARGRPTAGILLKKNGKVIRLRDVGDVTRDDVAVLVHTTQQAQCEDAGLYTCSANNEIGAPDQHDVKVFVNCRPRLHEKAPTDPPKLNYEGRPVPLSVDMVAFPVPDTFTFLFHGLGNNLSESVTPGKLYSSCWNPFTVNAVTCIVIVNDITPKNTGFYSLQIGNSLGHSDIRFEVTYFEAHTESEPGKSSPGGLSTGGSVGIGIGVMLLLDLFVVGGVVVWMWRRHWVLPCASSSRGRNSMDYNLRVISPPVSAEQEENQNANDCRMKEDNQQVQNEYEPLRLQDIGVRSEYADFTPRVKAAMTSADEKGSVYANTLQSNVKM